MRTRLFTLCALIALLLVQPAHADGAAAGAFLQGFNNSPMGNMPALMMQRQRLQQMRAAQAAQEAEEAFRKQLGEVYARQGLEAAKLFAVKQGRFEYVKLLNSLEK